VFDDTKIAARKDSLPMMLRNTRVGTFLLWLVLAVSVPLLVFTGGTVWRIQTAQRREQDSALVRQARDGAWLVDRGFERLTNALSVLAGSSALARGDLQNFAPEMSLVRRRLGDVRLSLMSPDGATLLQDGLLQDGLRQHGVSQLGAAADDVPGRQGTIAAIQAGKPIITNLLVPNDPSTRAVVVAVPVFRPGNTIAAYVLAATLAGAPLTTLADLLPSYPDGLVFRVRDRDGVTVSRSRPADPRTGEPAQPGWRRAIAGRPSGLLPESVTPDGVLAVRAFSVAPVSGYSVAVSRPRSAFGASIRRDLILTILIGLAFLVFGVIAATCLARRLVAALGAVGRGDRTPSGLREVDELAAQLHAISAARTMTEATLRDSETRLCDLVGTLDLAAIIVRELKGTIRFWSHGCERLYGWTRDEAVGRRSHELLRTQFPVPLNQIEHALLTDGEWTGDLVHRRRDGSQIIASAHKALKRDADGQPHMVMESLVDVTELRETEAALQTLNRNLEQTVRDQVAAREAAQQRVAHADRIQALGQLAGGIAHDFNNVLQAVAGAAALIARRPADTEAVTRLVQLIRDAAARGASITRRMLVLARRSDLQAEPIEVMPLLDGIREVFVHTLGPSIGVVVEGTSDLPRLLADKAQLETALVNLGTNARDAMQDGGMLRLVAAVDALDPAVADHPAGLPFGVYIRISVIDTGTGMSGATLARVGEPFFTTKDVGKGTGLGLSMVKGFAEQSGGGFLVESTLGAGTTATLWLPSVMVEIRRRATEPDDEGRPRLTGRILLVDDDDLVRDTLMEQLQELGHKVLAASGGTDALAILSARAAVDLMITDLSMPGMDGLTLIKRAQGLRPALPTILLTGFAGDAVALERSGLARSTYTLMRKPAPTAVLRDRVTELLERQ
jgi:PAS domain S-box-containing protein